MDSRDSDDPRTSQLFGLIEELSTKELIRHLKEGIAIEHAPSDGHLFVPNIERPAFCDTCLKQGHWWIKPDVEDVHMLCGHSVWDHAKMTLDEIEGLMRGPSLQDLLTALMLATDPSTQQIPGMIVLDFTDRDQRYG